MEVLSSDLVDSCRVATAHDAVSNAECCYTFHTPYTTDQGILVNLHTFMGTVDKLAMIYESKPAVFVRICKARVEKATSGEDGAVAVAAPTKLAIGVDGGFATEADNYDTVATHSVVVLDHDGAVLGELAYTEKTKESFPVAVQRSVDAVVCHVGVSTQQEVKAWQNDETIPVSEFYKELPFIDNGVSIDPNPSNWKCESTGATENLWLNLSDGYIGGGRKNWDGSGGSNGALDHFKETGEKFPLVVKLGTITADLDTADCFSYDPSEDGPVQIPNLAELLSRRGIKVAAMQKTVKSTAELEVELNANYAFDAITEAGAELQNVHGPGLQGLQNLGNSCYMNSIFQMLLSGTVSELAERYGCKPNTAVTEHPFINAVAASSASTDVLCQTSKLACALTSGTFAVPDDTSPDGSDATDPKYRVAPRMIKHCIGKDHVDFRTAQQQDAAQFLQYFLERLDRAELGASSKAKKHIGDPIRTASHLFSFQTTARLTCNADSKVKLTKSAPESIWSLRIPMDRATVKPEDEEVVDSPEQKKLKSTEGNNEEKGKSPVPSIALQTCLKEWANATTIEDLRWPHLGNAVHAATQTMTLTNFPKYIIIQLQRYELGPDWAPVKLEVNVEVPEDLDLSEYKDTGPNESDVLITDEEEKSAKAPTSSPAAAIDEVALSQLMDMGFSLNSCKRALTAVGGNNVEAAMGWVFEHNTDPDFNDPLPTEPSSSGTSNDTVDEGIVESLVASLGAFTHDQVRAALKETNGAADRAADWLFSHMDDIDGAIAALSSKTTPATSSTLKVDLDDGEGYYSLTGMISHIGKNTGSGHYVAHLKRDGKWVIFNDEKVALSAKPPFQHAYLYLFQRKDTISASSSP